MAGPLNELEALRAQVAALTARVYQLEQIVQPDSVPSPTRPPVQASVQTVSPEVSSESRTFEFVPESQQKTLQPPLQVPDLKDTTDFEKKVGQYWLNRIGIVAILIGVSYFLKYAFENNWIGPGGRIATGLLAGIALILWSERFRRRGYAVFSYSLKAVGIGTLYLSLWGAFQLYHLIPAGAAFLAMAIVTASTIALAVSQDAELLASFALLGGFATPLLLSSRQNHEVALFSYILLMDIAILCLAIFKPWRRLLWGSFAGTIILYSAWYIEYFTDDQRTITVCLAVLLAATFAVVPLFTRYERSTRFAGPSITLTFLPMLNATAFFIALYEMYDLEKSTLTWYALVLAAVYLGISNAIKKRFPDSDAALINFLHVAIAIAFITVAIPLKLEGQWITIGWIVESAVLLWVSVRTQTNFLRYLAVATLVLGVVRLLAFDQFHTETLIFNARFATYGIAIAVLAGIAILGKRHASKEEMPLLDIAVVALNLLALTALTHEVSDYFNRRMISSEYSDSSFHQLSVARGFSYSAVWLVYGAALMTVGFWRRSPIVRWQALILIACTIGKVFFVDVSQLGGSYRIVSFIGLGAVLLGISFVYQRDWLKLSSRASEKSSEGTASQGSER